MKISVDGGFVPVFCSGPEMAGIGEEDRKPPPHNGIGFKNIGR
ncbi:MAG: hypothetical protein ACYSUT_03690 [Planctomycetota bacterium]|jgi:hypothetical protein